MPYDEIYAMAGSLDGSVCGIRSTSEIVVIDQATAHARVIAELQRGLLYGRAWGASFPDQFVPEPLTALLLLTGSLVLLHTGRKSKRNTTPAAI